MNMIKNHEILITFDYFLIIFSIKLFLLLGTKFIYIVHVYKFESEVRMHFYHL